jgi:hypothetical protein
MLTSDLVQWIRESSPCLHHTENFSARKTESTNRLNIGQSQQQQKQQREEEEESKEIHVIINTTRSTSFRTIHKSVAYSHSVPLVFQGESSVGTAFK